MRILSVRPYPVLALMLLAWVVLSGCESSTATPQPGGLSPTASSAPAATNTPPAGGASPTGAATAIAPTPIANTSTPQATALPTGTPAAQESIETNIVYGGGDFDFPDPATGLSDLASYQASLTVHFEGSINGQPQSWTKTYVMLTSKNPQARRLTIERSRGAATLDPLLLAELDGASYQVRGQNPCTARDIEPGNSLADRFEPALSLSGVIGADKAGAETVNGAAADHYTFDQHALGEDGLSQVSGALWVASHGGYVVKYMLTRKGQQDYFGQGIEGTETIDYELTVPSQPVAVEIPATCPPGTVNAPQLPDAANIAKSLGILSYQSATSLTDATAFYQQALPKQGWTPADDPVTDKSSALLSYKQGNRLMTVILTAKDGGGTTVNIALVRFQE